jgi:energy-coupling factor transporter transmembrane protein EcfT
VSGVRGRARLLQPLLAGSLERSLNLAEAMEARGYGLPNATRASQPRWTVLDRAALLAAVLLVAIGALWL